MSKGSSIHLPNEGDCALCAYLRGDRPYTILFKTANTATLVTREQRGEPHLLVIPLRHVTTILDLTNDEGSFLMAAVREAALTIDRAYAKPGIAIWQNNGVPAGQAISHLHFHVAGTLKQGGTEWGPVNEITVAETDEIANRLRVGA